MKIILNIVKKKCQLLQAIFFKKKITSEDFYKEFNKYANANNY